MSIPLRVLLIEDSEDDAVLLLRELRYGGYEPVFERVDTAVAMNAALVRQTWDVVISDYSMPQFSAPAALTLLQKKELDLPVIIVSGSIGENTAVALMKAGAHDFILKGNLARLVPAIERELRESAERRDRKRAEAQIKASLQEKEVLLKEIHHRVKNNLQIISSLLNLQADYLKDNQAIEIFKDSQNRIESMALIHEKLYQSKDLAKINFADYIQELATSLFCSYEVNLNAITLKMNIEDVILGIDAAIPCGLIINELVVNSLKHAFPEGNPGEISIDFYSKNPNEFALIVSDSGIGLPKELDLQNTNSLGLQLVNALTHQLEGNINFLRNRGLKIIITFAK